MAHNEDLAQRIRAALAGHAVREVKMFGGISFMVEEVLTVSASRQGGMLARVDPDRVDTLLERTGAAWGEMRGRPMRRGWIHIDIEALDGDGLAFWLAAALVHTRRTTTG